MSNRSSRVSGAPISQQPFDDAFDRVPLGFGLVVADYAVPQDRCGDRADVLDVGAVLAVEGCVDLGADDQVLRGTRPSAPREVGVDVGGSALAANGDAGMAMLVTHISAATGAFTWMVMERIRFGKASALGIVTGMVAGLGTITPASGYVGPGGALIIGLSAGVVCFYATIYIKQRLKIDDSLDVFPVHGVGGILGMLLTGVFVSNALGVFSGQEEITIASQVGTQALGVVATALYTAVVTWGILKFTDAMVGNRVDEDQEQEGLDLVSHNERGYDL